MYVLVSAVKMAQGTLWLYIVTVFITLLKYFYTLENYIDGKEFTRLTEQEVKDMIPAIGIVKKIMRLIQKVII